MNPSVRWLALLMLGMSLRQVPFKLAIRPQGLTAAQVPKELPLPGKLLEAWQWQDVRGENVLLAYRMVSLSANEKWRRAHPKWRTQTASGPNFAFTIGEDDARSAQLFVRQYLRNGSDYQEIWRLQDGQANCPWELQVRLLPGSTTITDLNGNGQTETTVVYQLSCRNDVSPSTMKIIMHEGDKKYTLRGHTSMPLNHSAAEKRQLANRPLCCTGQVNIRTTEDINKTEGRYQDEKDFSAAPPAFLAFAQQQWRKWRATDNFDDEL